MRTNVDSKTFAGSKIRAATRTPAEVFTACPACGCTNLLKFEGEAFCLRCDWDSVLLHAECEATSRMAKARAEASSVYPARSTESRYHPTPPPPRTLTRPFSSVTLNPCFA